MMSCRLVFLALSALIVLTAQSVAIPRVMPDATGQMVICTGYGPRVVYTDSDGEPTSAPHLCPDCTLALVAITGQNDTPVSAATGLFVTVTARLTAQRLAHQTKTDALARGPPLSV